MALDRDPRIALLAQAQALAHDGCQRRSRSRLPRWRRALEKIPDALRAGPDFVVGIGPGAAEPSRAGGHPAAASADAIIRASGSWRPPACCDAGELLEKARSQGRSRRRSTANCGWLIPIGLRRPQGASGWRRTSGVAGPAAAEPDRGSLDERFVAGLRRRGSVCVGRRLLPRPIGRSGAAGRGSGRAGDRAGSHAGRTGTDAATRSARADVARGGRNDRRVRSRRMPRNPRLLLVRMQGAGFAGRRRIDAARERNRPGWRRRRGRAGARGRPRQRSPSSSKSTKTLPASCSRRTRPAGGGAANFARRSWPPCRPMSVISSPGRCATRHCVIRPTAPIGSTRSTQALELARAAGRSGRTTIRWPGRPGWTSWSGCVWPANCRRRPSDWPSCKTASRPKRFERRLRAEGVRLLIAAGRLDQAYQAAGNPTDETDAAGADLDFARLEAIVALWQKAAGENVHRTRVSGRSSPATQVTADRIAARALLDAAGRNAAGRHAEESRPGGKPGKPDAGRRQLLSRRANRRGVWRPTTKRPSGRRAKGKPTRRSTFATRPRPSKTSESTFTPRSDRFAQLAGDMPEHPKAAEAHLAAIYNAAEAAQADKQPLDRISAAARRTSGKMAAIATVGLAALGWASCTSTISNGKPRPRLIAPCRATMPTTPKRSRRHARSYERLLAADRAAGKPDEEQAREAAGLVRTGGHRTDRQGAGAVDRDLTRQAALAAARIWIADVRRRCRAGRETAAHGTGTCRRCTGRRGNASIDSAGDGAGRARPSRRSRGRGRQSLRQARRPICCPCSANWPRRRSRPTGS